MGILTDDMKRLVNEQQKCSTSTARFARLNERRTQAGQPGTVAEL